MRKICIACGKEFEAKEAHHRLCPDCWRKRKFGPQFPEDYLEGGYFDAEGQVKPAVVDTWAEEVAKVLGSSGITSSQLRRFFNQLRAIEAKLDTLSFNAVKSDIYSLKRDAAYAVGRGVVKENFKEFIDRNVELAAQDEKNFRKGFIEHFQSVLAYFTYYFRNR